MKKLYLLLFSVLFAVTAMQGGTVTETYDFPSSEWSYTGGTTSTTNPNWYVFPPSAKKTYTIYWYNAGTNNISEPHLKFLYASGKPTSLSSMPLVVAKVKTGTISFDVKEINSNYHSTGQSKDNGGLLVYKMNKTGDKTFERVGEPLLNEAPLNATNANDFVTLSCDVDEDCYIGIYGNGLYLKHFQNSYEQSEEKYTVSGVVNDEDGLPIMGATVEVATCGSAITDAQGKWTMENVPANELTYSITAPGFESFNSKFIAQDGLELTDTLYYRYSSITFTAKDWSNTVFLNDAIFSLSDGDTLLYENVAVNSASQVTFTIKGLVNEDGYTLSGTSPYCNNLSKTVYFTEGANTSQLAQFNQHELQLVVNLLNGDDAEDNAKVSLNFNKSANISERTLQNMPGGVYKFTDLNAAKLRDYVNTVTVTKGDLTITRDVIFNDNNVTLDLNTGNYTFTLKLVDHDELDEFENNKPLSGAKVRIVEVSNTPDNGMQRAESINELGYAAESTDEPGTYTFAINRSEAEGKQYRAQIGKEDYAASHVDFNFADGDYESDEPHQLYQGVATGISGIFVNDNNAVIYSIDGRKINSGSPAPGIYIINGKKILVK